MKDLKPGQTRVARNMHGIIAIDLKIRGMHVLCFWSMEDGVTVELDDVLPGTSHADIVFEPAGS